MAEQVKTILFKKNAKDERSGIPYVGGQEATVLASVADRMTQAGVAEVVSQSTEAHEDPRTVDELKKLAQKKNIEAASSMNKTQLIAALKGAE